MTEHTMRLHETIAAADDYLRHQLHRCPHARLTHAELDRVIREAKAMALAEYGLAMVTNETPRAEGVRGTLVDTFA